MIYPTFCDLNQNKTLEHERKNIYFSSKRNAINCENIQALFVCEKRRNMWANCWPTHVQKKKGAKQGNGGRWETTILEKPGLRQQEVGPYCGAWNSKSGFHCPLVDKIYLGVSSGQTFRTE